MGMSMLVLAFPMISLVATLIPICTVTGQRYNLLLSLMPIFIPQGEPNDYLGNEDCITFREDTCQWNDLDSVDAKIDGCFVEVGICRALSI